MTWIDRKWTGKTRRHHVLPGVEETLHCMPSYFLQPVQAHSVMFWADFLNWLALIIILLPYAFGDLLLVMCTEAKFCQLVLRRTVSLWTGGNETQYWLILYFLNLSLLITTVFGQNIQRLSRENYRIKPSMTAIGYWQDKREKPSEYNRTTAVLTSCPSCELVVFTSHQVTLWSL